MTPTLPLAVSQYDAPLSRRAGRVIERAQQAWLGVDVGQDFLLVPDVVPGGDDRRPGTQQVDGDARGDATAVRAVLAVDDDEIDPLALAMTGRSSITARRPGSPTMSPRNRMLRLAMVRATYAQNVKNKTGSAPSCVAAAETLLLMA